MNVLHLSSKWALGLIACTGLWAGGAQAGDVPTPAKAAKASEPVAKTGLSAPLGVLDWGATTAQVLSALEDEIETRYAKRLKHADAMLVDQILREKREQLATVKKSVVRFSGTSGLKSSVIGADFETNANESMVRIDQGANQTHYFFKDDKLWKVLVTYSAATQEPYPEFLKKTRSKHGAPLSEDRQGDAVTRAHWADEITHLMVEDRSQFFGSIVMKYLDKGQGLALESARIAKADAASGDTDPRVDSVMADIMGNDDPNADADIVDRLTGAEHKVDLTTGRPERVPVRQPEPRKAVKKAKKKKKGNSPKNEGIIF